MNHKNKEALNNKLFFESVFARWSTLNLTDNNPEIKFMSL
jgi:hypothetical protein